VCSSDLYRKNHIDLDRPNPVLSVTDLTALNSGEAYLKFLRNRNNNSGWNTSGSNDAANTELLIELKDWLKVDMIMLVIHNFKNFKVEYYDSGAADFVEIQNFVNNANKTTLLDNLNLITNAIKITVFGTFVADEDKTMRQLIITENFITGSFEGWPQIKKPVASTNRKKSKMLSGRSRIIETRGFFSATLDVKFLVIDNDLTIIENLYFHREGVLMLLSGGNEQQFRTNRIGYRNEDIVLVRPTNELELPYTNGVYNNGIKITMNLEEVVK
jgi:hypothetical protein